MTINALAKVAVPPRDRDHGQTEVVVVAGGVTVIVASFVSASDAIDCAASINAAIAKGQGVPCVQ